MPKKRGQYPIQEFLKNRCPNYECRSTDVKVVKTWTDDDSGEKKRRHKCAACGASFVSREK